MITKKLDKIGRDGIVTLSFIHSSVFKMYMVVIDSWMFCVTLISYISS